MCDSVDNNITSQLYDAGGSNYTTIASLAWRLVDVSINFSYIQVV